MPAALLPANELQRQLTVTALELNTPSYVDVYDSVVCLIQAATRVPTCLFTVLDNDRQFFKAHQGMALRETPRDHAFCGHVIAQQDLSQILHVEDASKDARFSDNPLVTGEPKIRFYAGLPIRARNGLPVGTLCVIDQVPRKLNAELSELLTHGRKLLEDQMRLIVDAIHDPLTGLYNRRFMQEALEREWRRAYRQLMPLAVVMLDIDHFKAFNDRYGHNSGDEALAAVAKVLNESCKRPSDTVARYGGEEFLVVLPGTDAAGTQLVACKIIDAVAALKIEHLGSPHNLVTISIGAFIVSTRAGLDQGYRSVIEKADAALYRAKHAGRNTFAVLGEDDQSLMA